MHDDLKPFTLSGTMTDKHIAQDKERNEIFIRGLMQDEGYIEVLDIDPQWQLEHVGTGDGGFNFKVTLYGIEDDEAWKYSGILNGEKLERHSANTK